MKKLALLFGLGIGFIIGSRAGRGPYEQIESNVRKMMGRPEVQEAVDQVSGAAKAQAGNVAQAVTERVEKVSPGAGSAR